MAAVTDSIPVEAAIAVAEKAGKGWFASRKGTPFRDALPYEPSAAEVIKPAAESLLPEPAYEAAIKWNPRRPASRKRGFDVRRPAELRYSWR